MPRDNTPYEISVAGRTLKRSNVHLYTTLAGRALVEWQKDHNQHSALELVDLLILHGQLDLLG